MSYAAAARCPTPTTSLQSSGDSVTVWFFAPVFNYHKGERSVYFTVYIYIYIYIYIYVITLIIIII